jgi:outer membrane protein OmpA-like peptidoglycan-associated protein
MAAAVLLLIPACAQRPGYTGKVLIKPKEAIQRGDSLYLTMDIMLNGISIESERSLTLTPVVRTEDHNKLLPSVLINGRIRNRLYRRAVKLGKILPDNYQVVVDRGNRWNIETIPYHAVIHYSKWMDKAVIDLEQDLCGCAGHEQQISVERLVDNISHEIYVPIQGYNLQPMLAYIRPAVEAVKRRSAHYDAYLYFPVGSSLLNSGYGDNWNELNKVSSFLTDLQSNHDLRLAGVQIKGSASIEGSEQSNLILGGERAYALLSYLKNKRGLLSNSSKYSVSPGGEDWVMLSEQINKQPALIGYRDELNQILSLRVSADRKEQLIKYLDGGRAFRLLSDIVFPKMRRVVCLASYTVRSFDLDDAKRVYATNPSQLSLEEMFRVANSYKSTDPKFGEVFETAVRLYPESDIANLNAAAQSLQWGNVVRAAEYLSKANPNTSQYMNNMGVYYLLKGDYDNAGRWLQKAITNGSKEAIHNREELQKKKASAEAMKSFTRSK